MAEVVERVSALEEALMKLAYAQFNTEMELQHLSKEMSQFKNEMSEFKDEMSGFKSEIRNEQKEMNRRWGEAVNRWGSIAEDLVYPNTGRIARDLFGAGEFDEMGLRVKRRHRTEAGRMREFDTIIAWEGHFLLVEVKATLRPEYFKDFVTFLRDGGIWDYFPEYQNRKLIPIFASFAIPESDRAYLTKERIFGMALGERTMEIVNTAEMMGAGVSQ